jgi:hypothetical protein
MKARPHFGMTEATWALGSWARAKVACPLYRIQLDTPSESTGQ